MPITSTQPAKVTQGFSDFAASSFMRSPATQSLAAALRVLVARRRAGHFQVRGACGIPVVQASLEQLASSKPGIEPRVGKLQTKLREGVGRRLIELQVVVGLADPPQRRLTGRVLGRLLDQKAPREQ